MGRDVSFSRLHALAAGLVLKYERNGTDEEIDNAYADGDSAYAEWLSEVSAFVDIPGTEYRVAAYEADGCLSVRANHRGPVYAPLTAWLRANGINWQEDY
jgi:hypothetical protein